MAFARLDGLRVAVAVSDKRQKPKARHLVDPSSRRRRTMLIGLAIKHKFDPADLAVWFGLSVRHVQRNAAKVEQIRLAVIGGDSCAE